MPAAKWHFFPYYIHQHPIIVSRHLCICLITTPMVAVFLQALQVLENHASCISNPQENCTEFCFHASVRERVKTKKALCMPMGILKNGMKIIGYEKYEMEKVACWELGLLSSQKSMGKCYYPTKHCKHFPKGVVIPAGVGHFGIATHGALHFTSMQELVVSIHSTDASSKMCTCPSHMQTLAAVL